MANHKERISQQNSLQITPYSIPYYELESNSDDFFVYAAGAYLHTKSGRTIIDADSSHWTANLGHNHSELKQALRSQLESLSIGTNFSNLTSQPSQQLAEKLLEVSGHQFAQVYFSTTGSGAMEAAINFSRLYNKNDERGKRNILSLEDSYHGSTLLTTSLGCYGTAPARKKLNIHSLTVDRSNTQQSLIDITEKISQLGKDTISAFVFEPVSSLFVRQFEPEFYVQLFKLLRENNILIIVDEIVSGFGRVNDYFAFLNFDFTPDIVVGGKAVTSGLFPLSFVLLSAEIISNLRNQQQGLITFGSTHAGHPLGCSVALKTIEILAESSLLYSQNRQSFMSFCKTLGEFKKNYYVHDIRAIGQLCFIEFNLDPEAISVFRQIAFERGLYIREGIGGVHISPPLNCKERHYREILKILRATFEHFNTLS